MVEKIPIESVSFSETRSEPMAQVQTMDQRRMDWHLIWVALGVIIPVIATTIACFASLSSKISNIENRLTKIETVLILQKIMPHEMAANNVK